MMYKYNKESEDNMTSEIDEIKKPQEAERKKFFWEMVGWSVAIPIFVVMYSIAKYY